MTAKRNKMAITQCCDNVHKRRRKKEFSEFLSEFNLFFSAQGLEACSPDSESDALTNYAMQKFLSPRNECMLTIILIEWHIHAYIHTYIHTCIHTYIHTYTYIYIYTHIYIHIWGRTFNASSIFGPPILHVSIGGSRGRPESAFAFRILPNTVSDWGAILHESTGAPPPT